MTNTMRILCSAFVLALLPAMTGAQGNPPAKAPAKKTDTTAVQHDMAGIKHDMAAMKHDMADMQGAMSGWKELESFHALLQMVWHPVGMGDFKPAREHGGHLLDAALAWSNSKGSAACDNAALRKGVPELIAAARAFADALNGGGSDDTMYGTLKRTHGAFEAIAVPCLKAGEKGMKMDTPKKP